MVECIAYDNVLKWLRQARVRVRKILCKNKCWRNESLFKNYQQDKFLRKFCQFKSWITSHTKCGLFCVSLDVLDAATKAKIFIIHIMLSRFLLHNLSQLAVNSILSVDRVYEEIIHNNIVVVPLDIFPNILFVSSKWYPCRLLTGASWERKNIFGRMIRSRESY